MEYDFVTWQDEGKWSSHTPSVCPKCKSPYWNKPRKSTPSPDDHSQKP